MTRLSRRGFTQVVIYIALKPPHGTYFEKNGFTQVVIYIALKHGFRFSSP